MTVYVLPPRSEAIGFRVDVTTRSKTKYRQLSPMLLGPVVVDGIISQNVENAWQYSKVYPVHWDREMERPTNEWYSWSAEGFAKKWADRYPMGKGAIPVASWHKGEALTYIKARRNIYIPVYGAAVLQYQQHLLDELAERAWWGDITIVDFDAYDHHSLGYTLDDVVKDPTRKMGHGFVLAGMIEKRLGGWGETDQSVMF